MRTLHNNREQPSKGADSASDLSTHVRQLILRALKSSAEKIRSLSDSVVDQSSHLLHALVHKPMRSAAQLVIGSGMAIASAGNAENTRTRDTHSAQWELDGNWEEVTEPDGNRYIRYVAELDEGTSHASVGPETPIPVDLRAAVAKRVAEKYPDGESEEIGPHESRAEFERRMTAKARLHESKVALTCNDPDDFNRGGKCDLQAISLSDFIHVAPHTSLSTMDESAVWHTYDRQYVVPEYDSVRGWSVVMKVGSNREVSDTRFYPELRSCGYNATQTPSIVDAMYMPDQREVVVVDSCGITATPGSDNRIARFQFAPRKSEHGQFSSERWGWAEIILPYNHVVQGEETFSGLVGPLSSAAATRLNTAPWPPEAMTNCSSGCVVVVGNMFLNRSIFVINADGEVVHSGFPITGANESTAAGVTNAKSGKRRSGNGNGAVDEVIVPDDRGGSIYETWVLPREFELQRSFHYTEYPVPTTSSGAESDTSTTSGQAGTVITNGTVETGH